MNRQSNVRYLLLIALFIVISAPAEALTLRGPDLLDPDIGHFECGIVIQPKTDIWLASFRFWNQGLGDVIYLIDQDDLILYSLAVQAGNPDALIEFNYQLKADSIYRLVSTTFSNSRYAPFAEFPEDNAKLRVLSSTVDGINTSEYWFSFTDLKTGRARTMKR